MSVHTTQKIYKCLISNQTNKTSIVYPFEAVGRGTSSGYKFKLFSLEL